MFWASNFASESAAASAVRVDHAEDDALVQQVRNGDMRAFNRLVVKYQDRVLNLCWRMCGHWEDAQDLAQEAFLRALRSISTFEKRSGFYTWLFRIAMNASISHLRKKPRQPRLALSDRDPLRGEDHQAAALMARTGEARSPAEKISARETERLVLQGIEQLDEEHRSVLLLRDIEGCGYQQIAEILELPLGTVKSRLARARMQLRDKLLPLIRRSDLTVD